MQRNILMEYLEKFDEPDELRLCGITKVNDVIWLDDGVLSVSYTTPVCCEDTLHSRTYSLLEGTTAYIDPEEIYITYEVEDLWMM